MSLSIASSVSCKLAIRVIPNASRTVVVGWLGDALKIKVNAPAIEGRANEEVCEFLADVLRVSRRAVTVVQGEKSRQKHLRIEGLNITEVRERLEVRIHAK